MRLAYFDEVKYQKGSQPYFWFAGILVTPEQVHLLETSVNTIAQDCFGSSELTRATEFHAVDIFHGKRNFKGKPTAERLSTLKRLAKTIDSHNEISKVYARIEPANMITNENLDQRAFVFFVERIERQLRSLNSVGMLIGDRDSDKYENASVSNLSKYRESGTPYEYGTELKQLIDTVHFTHSHCSRMLQLADVYAWIIQFAKTGNHTKYPHDDLFDYIDSETKLLKPHRYKHWPRNAPHQNFASVARGRKRL